MIIFLLLITLISSNGFINTPQKIKVLRGIKNIKSGYSEYKPTLEAINNGADISKSITDLKFDSSNIINSFINKPIGDFWTYDTLIENVNKNNVDSVSFLTDKSGLIVIDKAHELGNYNFDNLHYVKFTPDSLNTLIDFLSKNHINIDFYKLSTVINNNDNTNIFSNLIGQTVSFFGMYFLVVFIVNIVRGIFFNKNNPGMNPMDFMNGGLNKMADSGTLFSSKDDDNKIEILTKFKDVAGCDEAKYELQEVVDFLKNPEKYENAGAKIPTGVLLEGNPGTGKTLLARAVAGEAEVPFISASGSEFIEMYVGVGASRVRTLFEKAKKNSPCVVFIDEIDAVGRQRGAGIAGGNDEREQTLNQILTNMDGFETSDGIIVLAATNRVDILDKALIRPGRFDRKVNVGLPDFDGRLAISKIHFKNKQLGNETKLENMASLTSGFSGADIANLANEAAIFSVRKNETFITQETLYDAFEKVAIGIKSFSQEKNVDVINLVSYHEIGHALMVALFDTMFKLQKITINSNKNGAGGYTLFIPLERYEKFPTKKFLLANLIIALGGRAAEIYLNEKTYKNNELDSKVFKNFNNLDITTGATNDLQKAYSLAKEYITTYGFGEEFNIKNSQENELPFLGRDMYTERFGDEKSGSVEIQINELLKYACNKAYELIISNEAIFISMVEMLKLNRTIDGSEVYKIIRNHKTI